MRKRGPLRWEQSYRIFELIQANAAITAEELQAEAACIGVEISIRSAFRFLQRYRECKGDVFRSENHLQVIATMLRSAEPGLHFTAHDIQELAAGNGVCLHLSTIYRILHRLVGSGTIVQLDRGRLTLYEWRREEPQHGHLICTVCQRAIEFYQEHLEGLAKQICNSFEYEHGNFSFTLNGVCRQCRIEPAEAVSS